MSSNGIYNSFIVPPGGGKTRNPTGVNPALAYPYAPSNAGQVPGQAQRYTPKSSAESIHDLFTDMIVQTFENNEQCERALRSLETQVMTLWQVEKARTTQALLMYASPAAHEVREFDGFTWIEKDKGHYAREILFRVHKRDV